MRQNVAQQRPGILAAPQKILSYAGEHRNLRVLDGATPRECSAEPGLAVKLVGHALMVRGLKRSRALFRRWRRGLQTFPECGDCILGVRGSHKQVPCPW